MDPNRKVPDLYFKVVDPKLQVADLKAEVVELRSGGIPQFNSRYVRTPETFLDLDPPLYAGSWTPDPIPDEYIAGFGHPILVRLYIPT